MMNEPESRSPSKVTVEDLLRLKRAERPDGEFWTRFEQDFRTKQLAAAVEKKRWWHGWSVSLAGSSRLQLPLGAAAALAVTFLVIRQDRSSPSIEAALPVAGAPMPVVVERDANSSVAVTRTESAPAVAAPVATVMVASAAPAVTRSSGWSAEDAAATYSVSSDEMSPSARSIAANLAVATELEPELVRFLEGRPAAVQAANLRDPLADVTAPRDVRRNRLFAYSGDSLDHAVSAEQASQVRERLASRLSEDQLYDQVRRIGGGGDRLTVKF